MEQNFNLSKEDQELLVKISSVTYSLGGWLPSKGEWDLTVDDIKKIIYKHTKTYLGGDIEEVDLDINSKTGAIYAFVWIPNTSNHVCNNDLRNSNSSVNQTMIKYSPQMKEFMDKFCDKNMKRLFKDENNRPFYGIQVKIEQFMKLEFDENGFQFGKKFGNNMKRKTKLSLTCNYAKTDDGRFTKLNYLQVQKFVKTNVRNYNLRAKKSYNAH